MKRYYTKQFSQSLVEGISDWLNSFEEKRDGRPFCQYWVEVISYDVFGSSIVITICVQESN